MDILKEAWNNETMRKKENIDLEFLCNSPNIIAAKSIPNFLNLFLESKDKKGI